MVCARKTWFFRTCRARKAAGPSVALLIVLTALLISVTGMQQVKLAVIDALVPLYGMAMFVSDRLPLSCYSRSSR